MTPSSALGEGQAQVLAALIRQARNGPVTLGQLARDTGLTRVEVDTIVRQLEAADLVTTNTPWGPMALVRPLSIEQAATTAKERTR